MAERVIRGGVDTWVGDAAPSENHNGSAFVLVTNVTGNKAYALVFVKAPAPVAAGASVTEGRLLLHLKGASQSNMTFKATPLAESWKAGKATWANRPSVKTEGLGALPASAPVTGASKDDIVEFTVTPHLQAVADGDDWYGWQIEVVTSGASATFASSEAVAEWRRPRLVVAWSNAPVPPTDLAPSGGRFVSVSAPVLRYTFADYGGDKSLAKQQIQIETLDVGGDPTGVVYDTGWVDTVDPEYDLSADVAFTDLTNGAAVRWRVRVQDGDGKSSQWSDWSAFERLIKGTLAVDNPPVGADSFVTEVTPPIMWTHTGTYAQVAWQVIVQQHGLVGWQEVYNTGKRAGNDDAWTLPKGVLTRANWSTDPGGSTWQVRTAYRVVVRTWDGQQRERTPGDPVYYQATREFTVKEGTTVKVSNLQVSVAYPYPWAEVTWTYATAPDKFAIVRGGDIIDVVTPDEVFVSGTSYKFVDKFARPNIEHAWAVLPIVNGNMSAVGAAFVKATVRGMGIWLTNPDRDNSSAVCILGIDDYGSADMTMEDQGENFEIVGAAKTLRVTNSLKGYSGSVAGWLVTHPELPGLTPRDWANRVLAFKADPGQRLILTLSDMAIPIVAYNITVRPAPHMDRLEVVFDFFQDNIPRYIES